MYITGEEGIEELLLAARVCFCPPMKILYSNLLVNLDYLFGIRKS